MKDAYSLDRDDAGLERSFRLQEGAYHRVFERCGIEFHAVQAESGMMGGSASIDFLAPAGAGENVLVTCERGDYAADLEVARGIPRPPAFPEHLDAPEEVETPGVDDDRGARRAARNRSGRDVEGDAGHRRGRQARPRPRARRRPSR